MAKKQIIDIDAEFDGIEFDEHAIKVATGVANRPSTWKENVVKAGQQKKGQRAPNQDIPHLFETKQKIKDIIIEKQGIKCCAIDLNGVEQTFNSLRECGAELNISNIVSNGNVIFPLDGSIKKYQRGPLKGWQFYRIL
jgi:hypothetical protein